MSGWGELQKEAGIIGKRSEYKNKQLAGVERDDY